MALRSVSWGQRVIFLSVVLGAGLVGCDRFFPAQPKQVQQEQPTAPEPKKNEAVAALDPRFRQSFADATRKDPPNDFPPPPDQTMTGKSVGKIYEQVVKSWDEIQYVAESGKRLVYHALLDTEMGAIDIELRPDWAPNHVRSFVALARIGYYDGLTFEQTFHEEYIDDTGLKRVLDQIQGGCPLGTGDLYQGNIGYWLKDEINEKEPVKHEDGVVGACRSEEPDTGSCRFYITLCKASFMDGNFTAFGKVSQGLDIARKIWKQPTVELENDPVPSRPVKAVVIRKVTITTKEVDKAGPGGEN